MTRDELRALLFEEVARLAPEADPTTLSPTAPLRDELDLDSYDFAQLIVALDRRLGIDVPEADYRKLETLQGCLDYLEDKLRPTAPSAPP